MQGVFGGADCISVVLPASQAVAASELRGLAALLVKEAYELEVELGSSVRICDPPSADVPRLELIIDRDVGLPRLSLDRDGCVLAAVAPDVDGVVESLSLIRTLRTRGVSNVTAEPATDTESAAERLAHEVASTFPGFGLRGVEWPKLVDRYMSRLDGHDPVSTFERWVAELGDAHTRVRRGGPVGTLPYSARVVSDRIVLDEVQDGTAGFDAGCAAATSSWVLTLPMCGSAPVHRHIFGRGLWAGEC